MSFNENFEHDTPLAATCNTQLGFGALPCDAHHHFYHYQASAQYTLLARICFALGQKTDAENAITRALFQDHFNAEALAMKKQGDIKTEQVYDKHPLSDAEFLASIGQLSEPATALHDSAVQCMGEGEEDKAQMLLRTAISLEPMHSNSHFALANMKFQQKKLDEALLHAKEAIRLSHIAHDAYHQRASREHVKRAQEFATRGEFDLAINGYTKALDLHRGNCEALIERECLRASRK